MADLNTNELLAITTVSGFAIQQAIQVLDWPLSALVESFRRPTKDFPGGLSQAEFKKCVTTFVAFVFAWIVKLCSNGSITLLAYVGDGAHTGNSVWVFGDYLVTSLVLSAGTEAMNTLLKFVGYVKDARKPEPSSVVVSIVPPTLLVKASVTAQFAATVANAENVSVTWKVLQSNGGQIAADGLYTAPANPGTFHVMATSVADPTRFATAVVTVAP